MISFDLLLHSGTLLHVNGRESKKGLKLIWGSNNGGEYGASNPFMIRKKC